MVETMKEEIKKKHLKKICNEHFVEDVKSYIKSPHGFFDNKIPELKTMSKKLYEEHNLTEFYRIFDKLWNSGYNQERSLALSTLPLYREKFDISTWKFLKDKLKDIKSWDQIKIISEIIGKIILKNPQLEKEIIRLSKSEDIWIKRILLSTSLCLAKESEYDISLGIVESYILEKDPKDQKIIILILREINREKPELVKKFILKKLGKTQLELGKISEKIINKI